MSVKLAALGLALIAMGAAFRSTPLLVWNATASAPVGLYILTGNAITRGNLVLARMPVPAQSLAGARGYLPVTVPLVKRIAGTPGDLICAVETTILINGETVATRLKTDSLGRPLPAWTGCRVLRDEVFLLMADVPASFDGRYFGPVPVSSVLGRLHPLWTQTN